MGPAGQPDKASTSPSLCIWLPCLAVQSGVMQAASVQEQPLLKQNNLQKYRYSPCPRPDLAKEEQGSRPGQGLAQPHGAFGHRGCVHPTEGARPIPSPRVTLLLLLTATVAPTGRGSLPAQRAAAPVLSWARAHGGMGLSPTEELQAQCCSLQRVSAEGCSVGAAGARALLHRGVTNVGTAETSPAGVRGGGHGTFLSPGRALTVPACPRRCSQGVWLRDTHRSAAARSPGSCPARRSCP